MMIEDNFVKLVFDGGVLVSVMRVQDIDSATHIITNSWRLKYYSSLGLEFEALTDADRKRIMHDAPTNLLKAAKAAGATTGQISELEGTLLSVAFEELRK